MKEESKAKEWIAIKDKLRALIIASDDPKFIKNVAAVWVFNQTFYELLERNL